MVCTALLATMTANAFIRVLTAADAPAYKTLHDTVLHSAPEAFVSDLASALARPAQAYVPRFGSIASGRFFLGAFAHNDDPAPLLGCVGCERALYPQQRHSGELVGLMVAPPHSARAWDGHCCNSAWPWQRRCPAWSSCS